MILDKINDVNDIKKIDPKDYPELAEEIRTFLIDKISKTGGHLGSNLGAVELTMGLHLALNLPQDKIIWDVGHQSYTHKLLTGRKSGFDNLRSYGGMAGFPKTGESDCDSFNTGHSSTSVSAGLGMVAARDLNGTGETIVSVIGDGSMTGGMAYEALNNASKLETNFIIVLNDNNMSISENVGGVSKYLNTIRTSNTYMDIKDGIYYKIKELKSGDKIVNTVRRTKSSLKHLVVPGMFFEDMGITYLGPVDGHDVLAVKKAIEEAKKRKMAVLVHIITQKGRGYEPAIKHPARFHGTSPFDVKTGIPLSQSKASYTDIFSTVMTKLGARDSKVCAITAAMPDGTGLKRFKNMYPSRFFDVGIAEQHAVTFAAGLAVSGLKPVVAIYSSFLQRAYDQILHDVCIQNLPVIFAVDRAGLVGADGETHQGIFDLSYLSSIPNMTVLAPKNKWELSDMMKYAVSFGKPIAIRYPRAEAYAGLEEFRAPIEYSKAELIYAEGDVCIMAVGSMVKTAEEVRDLLNEYGLKCSIVNARFIKPVDEFAIEWAAKNHKLVVTLEENVLSGGYGEKVREVFDDIEEKTSELVTIALPDEYVEHGNVDILKKELMIDSKGITDTILSRLQ
ncbi:MAG: 1-deoxy-D-xylulose-5-phosphate synthase [Lachnospiraceae bacterium]|nr:1-deoxy-D-xylulose-5-phosphate synthase [Lachnospiraceae bacterium]